MKCDVVHHHVSMTGRGYGGKISTEQEHTFEHLELVRLSCGACNTYLRGQGSSPENMSVILSEYGFEVLMNEGGAIPSRRHCCM